MPLYRGVFLFLGLVCLTVGYIGTVTPGLPGFIFILLSLLCFKKSSSRFENWLLNHKLFGPSLRQWEENGAISKRIKILAISTMWVAVVVSLLVIGVAWVKATVVVLALVGTWYIASRPLPPEPATAA